MKKQSLQVVSSVDLDGFFDILKKKGIFEDLVVMLAYKYDHEKEYTVENELLMIQPDLTYAWENDWNEGQQNVMVLGYIPVREVAVDNIAKFI